MRKIAEKLSKVIIGGGTFNTQMNDDPFALPILEIMEKALANGINTIDTSPYYGPSEELIGKTLNHPNIKNKYKREDITICTKAGRIKLNDFDYSGGWIKKSVYRSLDRFQTDYLDLVYCHDIEFVTTEQLLEAVGVLFELQRQGIVHNVGISGYPPAVLSDALRQIKSRYDQCPQVIQTYAHFTIQNTVVTQYIDDWRSQGVECVITSSPLNMGLLSGKPAADFHPAPPGLREAALKAARYCETQNESLPDLALKFVIGKWNMLADRNGGGFIINGISFVNELDHLLKIRDEMLNSDGSVNEQAVHKYDSLFDSVREQFGQWLDHSWQSPPPDYSKV